MALSPYLKPSVLNGGLYGSTLANKYATTYGIDTSFDKRYSSGTTERGAGGESEFSSLSDKISNFKTVADMLTNALGTRSPYYKIGEIQATKVGQYASRYLQNTLGNMVRAVTDVIDTINDNGQVGVIIDGFGTVSGKIDVDITKNPIVFVSNGVADNRMRTPNTVNMTVYVSNYYNDDGLGALTDYLTSFDPTGIAGEAINILANNGNTRAQEALYNLRRLQERGNPFTVYTPHGVYENMLIKTLAPKTTAENVDMLECEITFQEAIMYEPYYNNEENKKYPMRTNVLDDSDASTFRELISKETYQPLSDAWNNVVDFAKSIWPTGSNGASAVAEATGGA